MVILCSDALGGRYFKSVRRILPAFSITYSVCLVGSVRIHIQVDGCDREHKPALSMGVLVMCWRWPRKNFQRACPPRKTSAPPHEGPRPDDMSAGEEEEQGDPCLPSRPETEQACILSECAAAICGAALCPRAPLLHMATSMLSQVFFEDSVPLLFNLIP